MPTLTDKEEIEVRGVGEFRIQGRLVILSNGLE